MSPSCEKDRGGGASENDGESGASARMAALSCESVRAMAECAGGGGGGALTEEAVRELADDATYKLRMLVQDAAKFMRHARRRRLTPDDVNHALRLRSVEPQYGFVQRDHTPFRFAAGNGRELFFAEERELDLGEVLAGAAPRVPLDAALRAHWLCVEGVQPTVPENPPPLARDAQRLESVDPIAKLAKAHGGGADKDAAGKPGSGKLHRLRNVETVHVKQLATHELSVEQQLYYKEITEACVGSDEARRAEALQSLSCDPGLHEMLPRMCTFISEGVKVNVVQNNLALLIYLMRMVKALLDNPTLYLEKYLHELIPSVTTCIVSKQLCMRPEMDNHWALRDFASRLMAQICKNFNTSTNNVQTRVTRLFCKALNPPNVLDSGGKELSAADKLAQMNERAPLASLYGAIQGLSELGAEVIKVFIVPRVKWIGDRILASIDSPVNADKLAAGHIKHLLVKVLPPVLKAMRSTPDMVDDYRREYGYLGAALHNHVAKIRCQPTTPVVTTSAPSFTPLSVSVVASTPNITIPPSGPKQTFPSGAATVARTVVVNPTAPTIGRPLVSVGTASAASPAPTQKYVIVTQKPPASSTVTSVAGTAAAAATAAPPQQINTANIVKAAPGTVSLGQKLVVVCMPATSHTQSASVSQAPVTAIPKPIFIGQGDAPPPPELDDLSHLA